MTDCRDVSLVKYALVPHLKREFIDYAFITDHSPDCLTDMLENIRTTMANIGGGEIPSHEDLVFDLFNSSGKKTDDITSGKYVCKVVMPVPVLIVSANFDLYYGTNRQPGKYVVDAAIREQVDETIDFLTTEFQRLNRIICQWEDQEPIAKTVYIKWELQNA